MTKNEAEELLKEDETEKLLNKAKEIATRNSKPEPWSEYWAKSALTSYQNDQKQYIVFLNEMNKHLTTENSNKKMIEVAKEIASQNTLHNPQNNETKEYAIKSLENYYEKKDETASYWWLNEMRNSLIEEENRNKLLETAQKINDNMKDFELTSPSENFKESEYYAQEAMSFYRNGQKTKCDLSLKQMKEALRKEEQEIQPQIKQGRSR